MLTSWSEQSTPAELSMKSVLIRPPFRRELDPALLRAAEIAALAHHAAAQLVAIDPDRVVQPILRLGLASRSWP